MKTLAEAQDRQVGDGTTSVIVFTGSLAAECEKLMNKGIHHRKIIEGLAKAKTAALEHIEAIATDVDITKVEAIQQVAEISLSSKVVSADDSILAPLAVEAVMRVHKSCPAGQEISASDIKLIKVKG